MLSSGEICPNPQNARSAKRKSAKRKSAERMTAIIHPDASADRMAAQARRGAAKRVHGLSDRSIAWLFVAPTIVLLLAINIFPLIWMIRLSFTSLNLSMSYLPLRFVGLDNYADILSDEDLWVRMQTTAPFVISTVVFEMFI